MKSIQEIRNDFPTLKTKVHGKSLIYFDNAATTLKCQSMINEITNHYTHETANIHRGVHFLSEQGTMKYESTRDTVQNFIHAQKREEIIFTRGTTESLNLLAESLGRLVLRPGDEILLSTLEHHSNIVPWQIIAEKTGAKVIETPINDRGEVIIDEYQKRLNSGKVKIVSMAYVSNALGTINPIKKLITMAHQVKALFVVDAAQAVAHLKVDVQDLDCDFLAFSAHKLFGPTGFGVLFGKEQWLNQMSPYHGGGDMIDKVTFEKTTYNILPHKFEAGTPAIAEGIAFKASLDYVQSIGLDRIAELEHELLLYATNEIKKIEGVKVIGEAADKSAVLSFVIQGLHPQDIGTILDQQGIAIRTGHHCTQPLMKRFDVTATCRASFAFYNTKEEIDEFIKALIKAKKMLE